MEISKEQAVKYLQNQGHEAALINGVVTVYIDEGMCIGLEAGKLLKRLRKALAGVGYTASLGVKIKDEAADNGAIRYGKGTSDDM